MRRIAVLFDNFGPYHIVRLRSAASQCNLLGIEIASSSAEYHWESTQRVPFERVTLFAADRKGAGHWSELFSRIKGSLKRFKPEALAIPGWSGKHAIAAARTASHFGVPLVLMSESQERDFQRTVLKERVKRSYVSLFGGGLVGGARQRDYLVKLGMAPESVHFGYDVVDNGYFSQAAEKARCSATKLRDVLGLPARYFLASARFIEKKNLIRLVSAYDAYCSRVYKCGGSMDECWDLVLLGDGDMRDALQSRISDLGLQRHVLLPGFKQYSELPFYYGLAEAFIHASTTEQWGLVVNEAMAAGLPVLVSKNCGCVDDLVEDGKNGFRFDPFDVAAIAEVMWQVSRPGCDRTAMGRFSQEIISRFPPDAFGNGLVNAAEAAIAAGAKPVDASKKLLLRALGLQ